MDHNHSNLVDRIAYNQALGVTKHRIKRLHRTWWCWLWINDYCLAECGETWTEAFLKASELLRNEMGQGREACA